MKRILIFAIPLFLLAATAQAANALGTLQESISLGKTLSVALSSSQTGWFINTNTNPAVASASLIGGNLIIHGLSVGSSTILACTDAQSSNCLSVNVTVGGLVLGASIAAHAPGSWVISGKTVFYITPAGIIPITTWPIFLSNGGKASLIQQSNAADLNLSLLPFLTPHDPRVQ